MSLLSDVLLRGTHAARPAASAANAGYYYWESDTNGGTLFQSSGSAWVQLTPGVSQTFTNPLTTAGDIIVGATAGALGRLAIGSDGDVLTVVSGAVAWAAPSGGGGGGGAWTQIEHHVCSGSETTFTFASIPATYNHLMILGQARTVGSSGSVLVHLQFNGDTGANYDDTYPDLTDTTTYYSDNRAANQGVCAVVYGGYGGANYGSPLTIWIPNYLGTAFRKGWQGQSAAILTPGLGREDLFSVAGQWRNTAAITDILITPTGNTFTDGSTFTLYGIT